MQRCKDRATRVVEGLNKVVAGHFGGWNSRLLEKVASSLDTLVDGLAVAV